MTAGNAEDQRLDAYWEALLDPRASKPVWLDGEARSEFAILDELNVARLLLKHDSTLAGATNPTDSEAMSSHPGFAEGQQIDGYVLDRLLGRGGMGIVYAAHQVALNRWVALKFIRSGLLATAEDQARFRSEASSAARLRHPGIVAVYDFGSWEGYEYISMEWVRGHTLNELMQTGPLSPERACRYTQQLCEAMTHAHEHGIIHRDLKPANILIDTETDRLRIMDFGLAKLIHSEQDQAADLTLSGTMVGTPSYMSPEQALGLNKQISAESDIYSLGAVLYEMLTGRPPFQAATAIETMRQVVDEEPAAVRSLNSDVSRDLETICLKCLRKAPSQRYRSTAAVAEDVRRVIEGRPILAHRVSRWRRAWKWCTRNAPLAASLGLLLISLLAGTTISLVMWRASALNAKRAEERFAAEQAANAEAQQQAEKALAVTRFFTVDVLRQADPASSPDRDMKLSDVLDAAATQLHDQFADKPLVESAIHQALGDTYLGLGRSDASEEHLRRAADIHRQQLGEEHPQTIDSLSRMGMFFYSTGNYAKAEQQYRELLAICERTVGPDHQETLHKRGQLAHAIYWQGRLDEAENIYLDVIERERRFGEDHAPALLTMNNLAILYCNTGKFAEAERLLTETLRRQRRLLGEEHPLTLTTLSNLGYVYTMLGEFTKAKPFCEQAMQDRQRVLGDHADTAYSIHNMGHFFCSQGESEAALPFFQQAYEMRQRLLGNEHPDTQLSVRQLGKSLLALGRPAEAFPFCEQAWRYANTYPQSVASKSAAMSLYGAALAQQADGSTDERLRAERLLKDAWRQLRDLPDSTSRQGQIASDLRFTAEHLIGAYERWQEAEEATAWSKRLQAIQRPQP